MPVRSQAQRKFLAIHHPEILQKWAAETPEMSELPEHKKKRRLLKNRK